MIDGRQKKNITIGLFVEIIQKPHQRTPAMIVKKTDSKIICFLI